MMIHHLVPNLPNQGCGVGDYAGIVSQAIYANFGVASKLWSTQRQNKLSKALDSEIEASCGKTLIAVHFTPFGFDSQTGCPWWLIRKLSEMKSHHPSLRVATIFHEFYYCNYKRPLRTWRQKRICKQLAVLSDSVLTNRRWCQQQIAVTWGVDKKKVQYAPVFSNVGELRYPIPKGDRQNRRTVIFGGQQWTKRILLKQRESVLQIADKLRFSEIIAVGSKVESEFNFPFPVHQLGFLSPHEASEQLGRCRFGLLHYPHVESDKSGILAAYVSHGIVPINLHPSAGRTSGGSEYKCLSISDVLSEHDDDKNLDDVSMSNYTAYRQFGLKGTVRWFGRQIA